MLNEGKYRDGGTVGSGKAGRNCSWISSGDGPVICAGSVRLGLRAHSTDEAEALARDGADQLLVLAAVADRLSRGVDAGWSASNPTRSGRPRLEAMRSSC